jgi:hypothetical protein
MRARALFSVTVGALLLTALAVITAWHDHWRGFFLAYSFSASPRPRPLTTGSFGESRWMIRGRSAGSLGTRWRAL